jgi:hypothetical protein
MESKPSMTSPGIGGAAAVVFGWTIYKAFGIDMPNEVTAAFASLFSMLFMWIETFKRKP